jgi:16S rRNA processing protein RimM
MTVFVRAGLVGRPHGLDGSFYVTAPVTDLLGRGRIVLVDGAERRIERRAGTDARPIVRLAGVDSREDAEALRGLELRAEETLAEGEFWAHDLAGCRVVDGAREIGVVARMIALPSCEALEVGDLLIPLVRDAIRSVDLEARVIDVDMVFVGEG